jgi:hypothetical protein
MPKRNQGYLELDHRNSPGLPEDFLARRHLPKEAGRGVYEAETFTCGHHPGVVIVAPERMRRERVTCWKCDRWLCDRCAAIHKATGGDCLNYDAFIAQAQELASRPDDKAAQLALANLIRSRTA